MKNKKYVSHCFTKRKECFSLFHKKKRMFHKAAALLLALTLASAIFSGCGSTKAIDCPLTDLGWETTSEELFEAEGVCDEPYTSIYGGEVYFYPATYMDAEGTLKYMYDENDVLMSVAFAYSSESTEDLKTLYDKLLADVEKEHGKSSYETDHPTNYGCVWELKEGHIILSVMLTNSNKALQIAYVNPLAQKESNEK